MDTTFEQETRLERVAEAQQALNVAKKGLYEQLRRQYQEQIDLLTLTRNRAIDAALTSGCPKRRIVEASGLSVGTVYKIKNRDKE